MTPCLPFWVRHGVPTSLLSAGPMKLNSPFLELLASPEVWGIQAPRQPYYSGIQILFNTLPHSPTDLHLALRVSLPSLMQNCCFSLLAASSVPEVNGILRQSYPHARVLVRVMDAVWLATLPRGAQETMAPVQWHDLWDLVSFSSFFWSCHFLPLSPSTTETGFSALSKECTIFFVRTQSLLGDLSPRCL